MPDMDPRQAELQAAIEPRPAPVGWGTKLVQMSRPTKDGGTEVKVMVELTFYHPLGTTVTFWSGDDLHRLAKDMKGAAMDANRATGAAQNGHGGNPGDLLLPEAPRLILPGE